jgi:transcriptional regulator with XRE-family HTH domain
MTSSPQGNTVSLPRQLRELKGLTQEELARLLGVAKPFVSQCESGKKRPGLAVAQRWEKAVGCPVSYWTATPTADPSREARS